MAAQPHVPPGVVSRTWAPGMGTTCAGSAHLPEHHTPALGTRLRVGRLSKSLVATHWKMSELTTVWSLDERGGQNLHPAPSTPWVWVVFTWWGTTFLSHWLLKCQGLWDTEDGLLELIYSEKDQESWQVCFKCTCLDKKDHAFQFAQRHSGLSVTSWHYLLLAPFLTLRGILG